MRIIIPNSKLLAILMLLVGMSASAITFSSGGLSYNILSEKDRTVEVTYSKDYLSEYVAADLEIPQKVVFNSKTYTVTSIGDYAFVKCTGLTSVTLPNSVTSIGDGAFSLCTGLISVTLPNSLTSIGESAFYQCHGLTSVTLPKSLISISERAFYVCSSLESLNVEAGNMMFSSIDGVLYNKDASKLIICPTGKSSIITLPETLTSIGDYAFVDCKGLISGEFPKSLISIGKSAFVSCSGLTSLTLPNSLSSIGMSAFMNCSSLESILIQCPVPIECYPDFEANVEQNAVLYVPVGTLAQYKKVDPWRYFRNIKEMNFSGIEKVEGDNDATFRLSVNEGVLTISGINSCEIINIYDMEGHCVYTGTGRCLDTLCSGIYIIKAGHKSIKFSI